MENDSEAEDSQSKPTLFLLEECFSILHKASSCQHISQEINAKKNNDEFNFKKQGCVFDDGINTYAKANSAIHNITPTISFDQNG